MPSTYTTNLGIEKIATGEQSGTWGTTTNTNLDLVDEAVNGIVTVTLAGAGSSGSPNTLAITNGASSDGRNKFIEFNDGGDLGGTAYVQLTPNDAEKIVHIRNSLSANRSILIFQGTYNASNDFEIPNGSDVVLKFDGAGAGAVVSDVFTNLDVTGLSLGGTSVTATAAELNYNDITTLGTSEASKVVTADANGDITIAGASYNVVWDKSANALEFGDDAKAIFGTGDDLRIYHDGSNSYIDEQGTGSLLLRGNNLQLLSAGSEVYLNAVLNGAVSLYYDNAAKLATTSGGISVTGNVYASGDIGLDASDFVRFTNNSQIDFYVNGGNEFRMESDGDFHADGDVIAYSTTISDARLKQNVQGIENAVAKVGQLNGYTFEYIADGKISAGVIAQEVEAVLPEAVSEKLLPLKTDDGQEYKVVNYDALHGLLIEAIKELTARVEALEAK